MPPRRAVGAVRARVGRRRVRRVERSIVVAGWVKLLGCGAVYWKSSVIRRVA